MTETVTALYDTFDQARAAVRALESAGVPHADISIVANNAAGQHDHHVTGAKGDAMAGEAAKDAGEGAGIGAAVGGLGGLLTGLGLMAIPGVGPVVAAGWLVATAIGAVGGAVVGAAAGGVVGALTKAGVREEDAHVYAEGVRRGGALVTARVEDRLVPAARSALDQHPEVNLSARREAYASEGWTGFDESAPAYTAEEVAAERSRFAGV